MAGRATGLDTGTVSSGNTHSQAGVFLKLYFPSLRDTQVYQETLGDDNLSAEVSPIGGALPFLSVSYQGGVYVPRLTADGLTDARFEYAILNPNYASHVDSLYFAYDGALMVTQWVRMLQKSIWTWGAGSTTDTRPMWTCHTERAPRFDVPDVSKERSGGFAIDLLQIPTGTYIQNFSLLGSLKVRVACEYVHDLNWQREQSSVRTLVLISGALWPSWGSWSWR